MGELLPVLLLPGVLPAAGVAPLLRVAGRSWVISGLNDFYLGFIVIIITTSICITTTYKKKKIIVVTVSASV